MTTPYDSAPETFRHRPARTPGAITDTTADKARPQPLHDHTEQAGRT
ncbi:hypothetical protein QF037_003712 [Streptomyces canus]|nr:hypothetical protein [Streptomyces canus]MDQ0599367.1 hypothetical protein [Streptomyces canus]